VRTFNVTIAINYEKIIGFNNYHKSIAIIVVRKCDCSTEKEIVIAKYMLTVKFVLLE
jgi:hypothetical protein